MDREIFETQDGSHSIYSTAYGVSYHSRYGAIQESRHVFIEAGLFLQAIRQKRIDVLEIGLGTGLNAFMTLLEAERQQLDVRYLALEAYPITSEQAERLNYADLLGVRSQRDIFLDLHRLDWDRPVQLTSHFLFHKLKRRFEDIDFAERFDLVYFDAFAPEAQPELWDLPVLSRIYAALRPGGVLVTYCAKGVVKRRFRSLGFEVEALPGPPGKREMTRCKKPG